MVMSMCIEDQVVGDAKIGISGQRDKLRDITTSLETRLTQVELVMADNHDRIGKLARGIEKCFSKYE